MFYLEIWQAAKTAAKTTKYKNMRREQRHYVLLAPKNEHSRNFLATLSD